jgi:3-phenylpropionate/trans-cinnamate dioxygenase ferredoxin reductase subunit
MAHYQYLIVGGGMTADAAIAGIRQSDSSTTIGLIGTDPHPPYDRPPLSKALWKGTPLESIWRTTDHHGVDFHLGRTVRTVDPGEKRVTDDRGAIFTYEKLLLATGGVPRRAGFGGDQIIYYRTLDDYERLRALTQQGERFLVIGGGFIGSEVAAALAMNNKRVVMVYRDRWIGGRVFPEDLAQYVTDFYRRKEVEIIAGDSAVGLTPEGSRYTVRTQGNREFTVDGIVAGLGIQPATELAEAAGLDIDNGIVVDPLLKTSHPDIFAAGDVAAFPNAALGARARVEHEDNANTMGRAAGQAMAGQGGPYTHLPFFYSDLFELGYEAVGDLDARLETVPDWKEPYREGVIYYMKSGRIRGVLLWNTWGAVDAARRLIADPGPFRPADLKGRLPASP